MRRVWMRIVATGAGRAAPARMIRVNVFVTVRASSNCRASHVVRRMAASAVLMGARLVLREHLDAAVTRPTRLDALHTEIVRLMAHRAFAMAAREESRFRNVRSLFAEVARTTARLGQRRGRVRMGVAGGARRNGIACRLLAVRRVNVFMALGARERHGFRLLVHPMALHALGGLVHADLGRIS
jgi:hypothetical protein